MKGAALFWDEAPDRTILLDDIMRTDLRLGVAQPIDGLGRAPHTGVMQDEHIDRADVGRFAAATMIWREALANLRKCHARDVISKKVTAILASGGETANFAIFYHGSR